MKSLLILIVLILSLQLSIFSQDEKLTGQIYGKIVDKETLQPLPKATIRVLNTKLGTFSDSLGNFTIKNIPAGRYSVSANIIGYVTDVLPDVVVTSRNTKVNFSLKMVSYQSQEIVVRADYFSNKSDIGLIGYSEISNQELKTTPGMPDLFKRLQLVAGVGSTNESSSTLIVRGGDPDENLTLLENMEIYSPFHFGSLNGEVAGSMSIIDPKLIDNVSMSTGGFSAKYGDKMSSITDIKIKEADKTKFTGDLVFDLSGLSAYAGIPISDNLNMMISGRRGILDWIMDMMDKKFLPHTYDFQSKITWDINSKNKLWFYGIYSTDNMSGNNVNNVGDDPYYSDISKTTNTFGLNWQYLFSDKGYLLITPYINTNKWEMVTGPEHKKDAFGDKNIENMYNLKADLFYRFNDAHKLTIGGDFRTIDAEYGKWTDSDTLSNGTIINPYTINFKSDATYKNSLNAIYTYIPFNWFNFDMGLRYDYFAYVGKSLISPRLAINFNINDDLSVNYSYGMYYQYPQYYKIFLSPENKNLLPSLANHSMITINYRISDDTQIKFEGFFKEYEDLAVTYSDSSNIYHSTGSGVSFGGDISLTKRMSDDLYLMVNYSFLHAKRKDSISGQYYTFRFDKPHSFNIMATYKLGDWWEIGTTLSYSTGYPFTPYNLATRRQVNGIWYCDLGAKNSERYPDYFRVDIRIERRFVYSGCNLKAYLEIWNLTDNQNIFEYNYSKDYLTRKSDVLFSFMPVIGLALEL